MNRTLDVLFCFLLGCSFASAQTTSRALDQEWRSYGHDPGGARFSGLKQINRSNVSQLRRAWTYHTGELKWVYHPAQGPERSPEKGAKADQARARAEERVAPFETTPLMVDDVLYFTTPASRVIALGAETGKEVWVFDPFAGSGTRRTLQNRGLAYWQGKSPVACGGKSSPIDRRIFYVALDARLFALDADTGRPCVGFGHGGAIDLRAGVADAWPKATYDDTSPPAIYKDLVITGAELQEYPSRGPSGAVRAFDVRTGKQVWRFDPVPGPGQTGHDTWEGEGWKDRSGTNVWSIMSVDAERGMIFLPFGSPSYDFYGADRQGQGLFGNSLVALDAATGKLIWYFQVVHHDLWDYDLPAPPNLVTVRRDGREIPAVAQVTKTGFVFVLDRLTGKPLFPVEERPVPQSKIPGEATWPTQPFPVKPPPLARISVTRDDITTVTPESREYCLKNFASALPGRIFNPWGPQLTIEMPGTLGGATWSGASFDPSSGYLFVNVNEAGAVGYMKEQPPGSPEAYQRASPWGSYARFWDENHYPCQQPPWGTLNAVDLNTGAIAWKVPLGVFEELEAKGIPQTGTPNLGGSIATGGGLVFIAATPDRRLRAFDSSTGRELWAGSLEGSAHATPMTFWGERTHKQYVVVAAGGRGWFDSDDPRLPLTDVVAAFALPTP